MGGELRDLITVIIVIAFAILLAIGGLWLMEHI